MTQRKRKPSERWHVGRDRGEVCDENGLRVAYVVGQQEDNSDAVLIAAAPQMRDALGDDPAGQSFHDLLTLAAQQLAKSGSDIIANCLRMKATEVVHALAAASGSELPGANQGRDDVPQETETQKVHREIEALLQLAVMTPTEACRLKEFLTASVIQHYLADGMSIREIVDMQRDLIR